jgi:phage tail sheath protein FI
MESMLDAFWREGAFAGKDTNEAYTVRCGRDTMSQNDLDNGRLIAEISVLPAAAIARITVVLDMTLGGVPRAELREVA